MIELWNVIIAIITGFVAGMAVHSAYRHSEDRGEF